MEEAKIKEILIKQNYISEAEIKISEAEAQKNGLSLVENLINRHLINKDILGQAIAEDYGLVYTDLNTYPAPAEQVRMIPERIAKKYSLVVVSQEADKVIVATAEPEKKGLKADLSNLFKNKEIVLTYSLEEDIQACWSHYRQPLKTRCEKIIKKQRKVATEVVNEIIKEALIFNASDIHFEPMKKQFLIRFRIDGVLQEAGLIDLEHYSNILNRIKVQADLRIDEHQATQDGAIRFESKDGSVDIRVSVTPTINGEKAVLRLLSRHVKKLDLADLGFLAQDEKKILKAAQKPFGMILVVGPTGSGKTTTLYALLKTLNRPEVNITTIEDPVEYRIENINQIQVNSEKNITFAKGLRAIVRQDPDIILVGEIRDQETAEISINAALTGHLLLSTFHANNAAAAIPRILDMGVEKFLLTSTLEAIIGQRLARKLCESCRYSVLVEEEDLTELPPQIKEELMAVKNIYKAKGCPSCNHTGYKGRVGLYEVINLSSEIKEAIMKDPAASVIWQIAKKQGARSLFEDGIEKVKTGITSLEELKRITSASEY